MENKLETSRISAKKLDAVNTGDSDFRAEVVVAGLIEAGHDGESIVMLREKGYKRNSSKDIHEIQYRYSIESLMEYLYISTSKCAFVENLPENIFYQSIETKRGSDTENILAQMRRFREEEVYIRQFFQPFEISLDQLLVEARLYERRFEKLSQNNKLFAIFAMYKNVLELMSLRQVVFFIKFVPELYRISADIPLANEMLSILFDVPIRMKQGNHIPITVENRGLGKCRLGVDFTMHGNAQTGHPDWLITVGPGTPEHIKSFHPQLGNGILLKRLFMIMMPADCLCEVRRVTAKEHAGFRLSSATHTAYLGINTHL